MIETKRHDKFDYLQTAFENLKNLDSLALKLIDICTN